MKTIKTLQMRVMVGLLYSAAIMAEGHGWDFMYLAPTTSEGISFRYARGKYKRVYDSNGRTTDLLQQHGPVHADTLLLDSSETSGKLAKSSDISSVNYQIISDITDTTFADHSTYAQLSYTGSISFSEMYVGANVRLTDSIRFTASLPIFRYKFTTTAPVDLSPATGNGGFNQGNADWVNFLKEYTTILAGYGLQVADYKENAVGDLQCALVCEDLIRREGALVVDGRIGFVAPTGKRERLDQLFAVDYGYKKQWGGLLGVTLTTLHDEHCQLQAGTSIIFFADATHQVRMYTDKHQSSFIKLAQGRARHDVGTVWNAYGTFTFLVPNKPLHLVVGYACNGQGSTYLYPENTVAFKDYIVNTDPKLKKWVSHTIFAEVSLVKELENTCCDQINVSAMVDYPFAGRNTMRGVRYGGSCGVAVQFDF